ncbi:MAG: FGGY-family carbohydrate kinase, partial [Lachnospiraceae bacterium]
ATLESLAYQTYSVLKAMEQDTGIAIRSLRVDGGACANNFLMQFQADILAGDVLRPSCIETTALGAAYLAGLATGYWRDKDEIRENWQLSHRFIPSMEEEVRKEKLAGWDKAVACALNYSV